MNDRDLILVGGILLLAVVAVPRLLVAGQKTSTPGSPVANTGALQGSTSSGGCNCQ